MQLCENQFGKFNSSIRIDDDRKKKIESAFEHFTDFSKTDPEISTASDGHPFLQGSMATHTIVKPLKGGEFDVDIVYPFKLAALRAGITPAEIRDWFFRRLRNDHFYNENLISKPRCARIEYKGEFHLDIIPARKGEGLESSFYFIPTKDSLGWKKTTPLAFRYWVQNIDEKSGGKNAEGAGRFVRCVRIMKRWRDRNFIETSALPSIALTAILGQHEATNSQNVRPPLQ
ncbi:MAG: nucleotidyltransferase, partial [bacterium]|nr:nucleotidyltransferase [bacterium]